MYRIFYEDFLRVKGLLLIFIYIHIHMGTKNEHKDAGDMESDNVFVLIWFVISSYDLGNHSGQNHTQEQRTR
jgi:hypothetical protein